MTTKAIQREFKRSLHRRNYLPYRPESISHLESISSNLIEKSGGAIWYADLFEPLNNYLLYLFDNNQILKNSYCRDKKHDYQRSQIEKEIKERARNQLKALRENPPSKFKVGDIYSMLRSHFNLNRYDSVHIESPTPRGLEEGGRYIERIDLLMSKRILLRKRSSQSPECSQENRLKEMLEREIEQDQGTGIMSEYLGEKFRGTYIRALGETNIAYTDTKSAMKFLKPYLNPKPIRGRNITLFTETPRSGWYQLIETIQ